jgi:hypothetical protein
MALRREILSYVGTGAIGGIIGYYARARGLLGLQQEPTRASAPPSETETAQPEIENPPETETDSPESISSTDQPQDPDPGVVIIDDFESESLEEAWVDQVPPGGGQDEGRSGMDGGRSAFNIQSEIAPEGESAVEGTRDMYNDGTSTIRRSDFSINQEGSSLQLYAKTGPLQNGGERANKILLEPEDDGQRIIVIDQKNRPDPTGRVISEKLSSIQKIELNNISFQNQSVGEVIIDGEVVENNLRFLSDEDVTSIESISINQGHFGQSANIVVDRISYQNN